MNTNRLTLQLIENMFRNNYRSLYLYALSIVKDEHYAKDIINDTFLYLWNNRERLETSNLKKYLYMTVRSRSLSQIGRNRLEILDSKMSLIDTSNIEAEEYLRHENMLDRLEKAIDALPERTRYILEQCCYRQRSYKDLADELGMTTDGVKYHIVKAFNELRKIKIEQ